MKKYNITVNGNMYEVEVEEADENSTFIRRNQVIEETPKSVKSQSDIQPKIEEKPKKKTPEVVKEGVETISSPMPGSILDVKVSKGDTVEEGDVLLILEAMKMENEIMAPRAGKIVAVNTSKGESVNSGDPLISLE